MVQSIFKVEAAKIIFAPDNISEEEQQQAEVFLPTTEAYVRKLAANSQKEILEIEIPVRPLVIERRRRFTEIERTQYNPKEDTNQAEGVSYKDVLQTPNTTGRSKSVAHQEIEESTILYRRQIEEQVQK